MPTASATSPMMPPRASTSRTRWPLATPPTAGLQLIWAIRSRFMVISAVFRPMRAAAMAASHPAWPAPTTATSYCSLNAMQVLFYGILNAQRIVRRTAASRSPDFCPSEKHLRPHRSRVEPEPAADGLTMIRCTCGNPMANDSALCDRCAALQALELRLTASADEIKAAYLLLVKVWHPDRFQHDVQLKAAATEKLKAINAAYRYLTSSAAKKAQRKAEKAARTAAQPSSPVAEPAGAHTSAAPAAPAPARRRVSFGSMFATLAALGLAQRLIVLACGLGATALLVKFVDYQLASDPASGAVYAAYKLRMAAQLEAPRQRAWNELKESISNLNPFRPAPSYALPPAQFQAHNDTAPPAEKTASAGRVAPKLAAAQSHISAHPQSAPLELHPFITVGLTKDEVIAAAGAPTSTTDDKLVYTGAEIDLKNGKVAGWKIDPAIAKLRVKLWPSAAVDPDVQYFTVDSPKNVVLVVQGTPTTFTDNVFAYGNSEVYFRNNRVVSWKNDPGSVPLRAMAR